MAKNPKSYIEKPSKRSPILIAGLLMTALVLLMTGCAPTAKLSYVPAYENAIEQSGQNSQLNTDDNSTTESKFKNLELLFSDIKNPDLENRIAQTYSEQLYFNDTFHTFNNREDVTTYLLETAGKVIETKTVFEEFAKSEDSYFVRWKMFIEFEVGGKNIKTESIGISQIKFNDEGKIIFHQDFWDNTEGFFRHIPIVGSVLNRALSKL